MKELGQFLKSKREEKKIPLEEVAVSTKISIKVLQALEEGNVDKLPAKPFIRGFVQSYARYLGLDVKDVLERFQDSMGSTNPKAPISIPQTENLEKNLPGSGRQIITVVSIIIVIIVIVVVQRILSKRENELHKGEVHAITGNDSPLKISPSLPESPSPVNSPSSVAEVSASPPLQITSSPSAAASPVTTPLIATPSPASMPSPTPTPAPTPTPKPNPTPTPTPTSTPTPTPTPSPTPTPKTTPTPKPTPTATPAEVVQVPQEVIVEALDRVTLKVTIDSKAAEEVTLNADQIQTFRAKGSLKLFTPNGGAISIIHNGFDMGVPGNLGQPKTMAFPK
jgi:cytoskeleton protein RodZ